MIHDSFFVPFYFTKNARMNVFNDCAQRVILNISIAQIIKFKFEKSLYLQLYIKKQKNYKIDEKNSWILSFDGTN